MIRALPKVLAPSVICKPGAKPSAQGPLESYSRTKPNQWIDQEIVFLKVGLAEIQQTEEKKVLPLFITVADVLGTQEWF